jgi:hypothetical protein
LASSSAEFLERKRKDNTKATFFFFFSLIVVGVDDKNHSRQPRIRHSLSSLIVFPGFFRSFIFLVSFPFFPVFSPSPHVSESARLHGFGRTAQLQVRKGFLQLCLGVHFSSKEKKKKKQLEDLDAQL